MKYAVGWSFAPVAAQTRALPKEAVEVAHAHSNWCPCSNDVWCNVDIQYHERLQTITSLMYGPRIARFSVPQDLVLMMHRCRSFMVGNGDVSGKPMNHHQRKAGLLTWWI
ncbi:hypothetical protein N7527_011915 [Penicillium freii]|nr:hypothetical protein N7527_011915 [Penicillium freii]